MSDRAAFARLDHEALQRASADQRNEVAELRRELGVVTDERDTALADRDHFRERFGNQMDAATELIAERDALSAVIDKVREPSDETVERVARVMWSQRTSESWDGRLSAFPDSTDIAHAMGDARQVLSVLAAGLAAPVGETPDEPGGAYRRAVDFAAAKTQDEKIAVLTRGLPALPTEPQR